ncbi:MAG TPA: glycosyl hydrolase family 8 [Polyangia bacterium]|nr:glycosyl hydrolase family 8 [Polyangia bacterium]
MALACTNSGSSADPPGTGSAGAVAGNGGSGGSGSGGSSGAAASGGSTGGSSAGTGGSTSGGSGTIGGAGTSGAAGTGGGGATGSAGRAGSGGATSTGGGGSGGGGAGGSAAGTGGMNRGGAGGSATGGAGRGGTTGTAGTTGVAGSAGGSSGTAGSVMGCRPAPTTYRNLFTEVLGKSASDVDAKVNAAFQQLFHGTGDQPIYYEFMTDEAYLLDVVHNDVRSEGVSYGMMIAVQLDKKAEFDRLWRFAVKRMRQSSGFFAWQLNPQGGVISSASAPDGEEYFATALMFASKRWGDGTGDLAYGAQARTLLDKMANNGMFDRNSKLVLFGVNATYTDPSYMLPAFYEAWACFDSKNRSFWGSAATAARAFFPKTVNATTGLAPDQAQLSGAPYSGHPDFDADAWRVVSNIMTDHHFFGVDPWQVTWAAKHAAFWKAQGSSYGEQYTLAGMVEDPDHQSGLVALNATLGFALPTADGTPFLQELWDTPLPSGSLRYYNGSLYMLSLLHVSGQFHLWY